jgi:hypothetical protein
MAHTSSTSTDVAARRSRPSRHIPAAGNLAATTDDESYQGSTSELPPATSHRYAEWEFSGVLDLVIFQRFLNAADYWFDSARECFVVIANDQANTANAAEDGDGEVPPTWELDRTRVRGQARELDAKLAEGYHTVRLLCASIAGEASVRRERAHELGKQARELINANFDVDNPSTPLRASQKLIAAATLLRVMPAPSTPEARNLQREAQALIEQAAVQQAESSASRIRQQGSARDDGGAQGPEASVHASGAVGQPTNQGRTLVRERILDTCGQAQDSDARNVINARQTGNAETRAAAGYYPRRGGRYDSREDRSLTPEPPGTHVFSREIRTTSFPQRFRQPTSSDKYTGETDPRVFQHYKMILLEVHFNITRKYPEVGLKNNYILSYKIHLGRFVNNTRQFI